MLLDYQYLSYSSKSSTRTFWNFKKASLSSIRKLLKHKNSESGLKISCRKSELKMFKESYKI